VGQSIEADTGQETGLYSLEAGAYEQDPDLAVSLLRAFADTTTDAVMVKDLDGCVLLVNPVAVGLFGVGEEGLLGRHATDFYGDLSEAGVAELHDRLVIDDGVSAQLEEELLLKAGQRRTLLTHKTPWRDHSGQVIGLVCISRDVTERKELERMLLAKRERLEQMAGEVAAAEARYRSFFENLTEAVLVYEAQRNPLGEVTGWVYRDGNTAAEQGFGTPLRGVLGRSVAEVLGAEKAAAFTARWPDLLRTGEQLREEYESKGRHYSARRFRMGDDLLGVVALDVTELHQLQARLMQSDRLASIGLLAAGVAHEVNNPLAWLSASLEFVEDELRRFGPQLPGDFAEVFKALKDARDGASRIKHVVRDLKTFARNDLQQQSLVRLDAVIDSAIGVAGNEIRHRAKLVRDLRPAPLVLGSEARLGQVVVNLLINAAQALAEGKADEQEVRVTLFADARGWARLEVMDTGTGIPPEVLPHIFDPFFTTKPVGVGTGLGLSICRNLVTQLGGELGVESEPGKGALFFVALPPAASQEVVQPDAAAAPARAKVLVLDDEPAILDALRRMLAPEHEVTLLADAREAFARICAGVRFDVILSDLMMPQMTGMELHQRLLATAPEQAARMVFITGGGFTESARTFLNRVANPRVEKPFDRAQLRQAVRATLQQARG
jgi:PAS domain S-box-containing protein